MPMIQDVRDSIDNKFNWCSQSDCIEFVSLTLYAFFKLKRFSDILDLVESFYVSSEITNTCNPFSLYYIVEAFRDEPSLSDLFQFESLLFR